MIFRSDKSPEVLVDYVQQAASAKTIGILVRLSNQISEQLLSVSLNQFNSRTMSFF